VSDSPPSDQPWCWQSRELRTSDAWRSQGINVRRLIDFLLLEHMRHGGKRNGLLKAPYKQLVTFGLGSRHLADAIREAEELGLVDRRTAEVKRGSVLEPTLYGLTWLKLHDGTPASNRWRNYRNPSLAPVALPKVGNSPAKGSASPPAKGSATRGDDTRKRECGKRRPGPPAKGNAPYRRASNQDGADTPIYQADAGHLRNRSPRASVATVEPCSPGRHPEADVPLRLVVPAR
jgi:hypothetical protein